MGSGGGGGGGKSWSKPYDKKAAWQEEVDHSKKWAEERGWYGWREKNEAKWIDFDKLDPWPVDVDPYAKKWAESRGWWGWVEKNEAAWIDFSKKPLKTY